MPQANNSDFGVSSAKKAPFDRDQTWSKYMIQVQSGDAEALSQLYDESSSLVFSVALRILNHRDDAEEVTLDVYKQVWNIAADWKPTKGSVSTWLILMSRSRALDRLRWRSARSRQNVSDKSVGALSAPGDSPEAAAELQQRRKRMQRCVSLLTDSQRNVLELAFYGGLSHQEIAGRLNEPLGTVKSRIRSAILRLRSLLEEPAEKGRANTAHT